MTKTQDKKWTIVELSFEPTVLFLQCLLSLGAFWDKMGFGPKKKKNKTQIGSCDGEKH